MKLGPLFTGLASGATVRWSDISDQCTAEAECTIPAGDEWLLDADMDVGQLTVNGKLTWDTTTNGVRLTSGAILVNDGATFECGTVDSPMLNEAEIYIKYPREDWNPKDETQTGYVGHSDDFGSRFFVGTAGSSIYIHGEERRTWTLLSQDADDGATEIHLKHAPLESGWHVGDEIAIATTWRKDSTRHTIAAIGSHQITIDPPLDSDGKRHGGVKDYFGFDIEKAAEVINLTRNIKIFGPDEEMAQMGFHFGTFGWEENKVSNYNVQYARLQNCGQNDIMGRYCFHFHLKKKCPECYLKGNAIVNSRQGAIVVHGTHESNVEENVMWNPISVGIYTEDGNEMNNTFTRNVVICRNPATCRFHGETDMGKNEWQGGSGVKEGGFFWFGMTNNAIENRVSSHEHGMWTRDTGNGKGAAAGKVCTKHTKFGTIQANVFHDNGRFGMYPDNLHPRDVERDEDGYVTDWDTCKRFKPDGRDNGATSFIDDNLDYNNLFVGGYAMGDISFRREKSIDNASLLYWKESKNFGDGVSYHVEDGFFAHKNGEIGMLHALSPGRHHTFRFKNTVFAGSGQHFNTGAILAPQHCGLDNPQDSTCMVHFLFENTDFEQVQGNMVSFGSSGGNPIAPQYISFDESLGEGVTSALSPHMNGFENTVCSAANSDFSGGYSCNAKVRRLALWANDMGNLTISGPGYDNVEPNEKYAGANAGNLIIAPNADKKVHDLKYATGYAAWVQAGQEYTISGLEWNGDIYFAFSDIVLPTVEGIDPADEWVDIVMDMNGQQRSCRMTAGHSRLYLAHNGIGHGYDGSPDCTQQFWQLAVDAGVTTTTTTTTTTTVPEPHACDCADAGFDVRCHPGVHDPYGGLGCWFCGKQTCRICGVGIYPDCVDGDIEPTGPPVTQAPGSTTTTDRAETQAPTTPEPQYSCDECGGTKYDWRCHSGQDPYGGIGCAHCGLTHCRICDENPNSPYISCELVPDPPGVTTSTTQSTSTQSGQSTAATTTTTTTTTTTVTEAEYECDCGGTKYDERCWNSDMHDPHGGLGCNGCNKPRCRFCDEDEDSHWISCATIPDITSKHKREIFFEFVCLLYVKYNINLILTM